MEAYKKDQTEKLEKILAQTSFGKAVQELADASQAFSAFVNRTIGNMDPNDPYDLPF